MSALDSPRLLLDADRAGRAMGAMFFFAFGGAWIGLWAYFEYPGSRAAVVVVAMLTLVVLGVAWRVYRSHAPALKAVAGTPERRRRSRLFNAVNAGQWIVVFVVASSLAATGHDQWTLPAVIAIVGLHFLPLARLFRYRPHWVTGIALVLLACLYPFMATEGPESGIGPLGAGLILWASGVWALALTRPVRPPAVHRPG